MNDTVTALIRAEEKRGKGLSKSILLYCQKRYITAFVGDETEDKKELCTNYWQNKAKKYAKDEKSGFYPSDFLLEVQSLEEELKTTLKAVLKLNKTTQKRGKRCEK